MTTIIILSGICTILMLLLIISWIIIYMYRKQVKLQDWIFLKLEKSLSENTDAIRELGDDIRQSNITLNMDCLIREYTPSPELTPKDLKIDLAKMLADIFNRASESANKQL